MSTPLRELQYPIGEFSAPEEITPAQVDAWITDIEVLPRDLRAAVTPLSDAQLDTPYRPDGWTVRQVVHHVPDSHINSYVRFRWALTESRPEIKTYWEDRWALLPDYAEPVELSLNLLDAVHARWVPLLRALRPEDLQREFVHPDSGPVRLAENIGIYAWHGRHHLAHIETLATREGW
ncbi:MAG: putative metal-dependent hydrolase [Gemmatimonadetes bacterium]|nr:putative metal-dependent hydrolase [Gemmatimonadota bacterium]